MCFSRHAFFSQLLCSSFEALTFLDFVICSIGHSCFLDVLHLFCCRHCLRLWFLSDCTCPLFAYIFCCAVPFYLIRCLDVWIFRDSVCCSRLLLCPQPSLTIIVYPRKSSPLGCRHLLSQERLLARRACGRTSGPQITFSCKAQQRLWQDTQLLESAQKA